MRKMRILAAVMVLGGALAGTVTGAAAQTANAAYTDPHADLSLAGNAAYLAANAKKPGVFPGPGGLQFKILQNGFGNRPGPSDTVEVYYTGTLINGTLFDGTSPGLPAQFKLVNAHGQPGVIPGWIEALQRMREGDHWIIWVPANLAYGAKGAADGLIPPNQTLVFDIRLVSTKPPPKPGDPDYQPSADDDQGQGQ